MDVREGSLVAGRFEIEAPAGAGGMAVVFRARDRHAGGPVAVKLLKGDDPAMSARFDREASLLAQLTHPSLVRYVDHGRTADGQAWIAMEWLEGETLGQRLSRRPLTMAETLEVIRRVAEALAEVHRRGVIHRDVKPSNIFLLDRDVTRVKVLDFGIARFAQQSSDLTVTGARVGTFAYMSPEQAWARRELDASTDVFSLGAVFFACLTGKKPFAAKHATAVLAKILLEEPPRVSQLRPEVPVELDELVAAMMAKEPADRPPDGAAVARAIGALELELDDRPSLPFEEPAVALTSSERRVVTVLLAPGLAPLEPAAGTQSTPAPEAPTVLDGPAEPRWIELRDAAIRHGARLHALADGTLLASFASSGGPIEHALKAARFALEVRALAPEQPIALATGLAQLSGTLPVGDVIDRAVETSRRGRAGEVFVDDVTAGLLGGRFELAVDERGLRLASERDPSAERRELLGRASPFVGRRRELRTLEALYEECVDEEVARVALITGPAGLGKSRVRFELLARLASSEAPPTVLLARADPVTAGAPLGVLADALRRTAQIREGEPVESRVHRLRARLARVLSPEPEALERCVAFLGELVGAPALEVGPELAAARADARLMGDRMRAAFEEWLAAETRERPVVFVIEDLQWGDPPSVAFLDSALRNLAERSWLLLALARPEVHERFPGLWAGRAMQELPLTALTRKAAGELVGEVLGDVDPAVLERVIELAAGNAFYLEELIRTVASGSGDALPPTVIAMVQARLGALPEEGRRVLRAASVFGKTFWRGGVLALLGNDERTANLDPWIDELVSRELVSRRAESRFPSEPELVFRHSLVREGAYATLTDEDRARGHGLAAEWLTDVGEPDPFILGTHYANGGDALTAAPLFVAAAEHALEADDLDASFALAERALVEGASAEVHGRAHLVRAEASRWRGRSKQALEHAASARGSLSEGSARWYRAATELVVAMVNQGRGEEVPALAREIAAVTPWPEAVGAATVLACRVRELVRVESAEVDAMWAEAQRHADDPLAAGWVAATQGSFAFRAGDMPRSAALRQTSIDAFERIGNRRAACTQRMNAGHVCAMIGDHAEAHRVLSHAQRDAERLGLEQTAAWAQHNLGLVLTRLGRPEEGLALERRALAAGEAQGNGLLRGICHLYLAQILVEHEPDEARAREALEHARACEVLLDDMPTTGLLATATAARAHVRLGQLDDALARSEAALAILRTKGADESEALVHLARVEALEAAGRSAEARAAADAGWAVVWAAVSRIEDGALRERAVRAIPEHAALHDRVGRPAL